MESLQQMWYFKLLSPEKQKLSPCRLLKYTQCILLGKKYTRAELIQRQEPGAFPGQTGSEVKQLELMPIWGACPAGRINQSQGQS